MFHYDLVEISRAKITDLDMGQIADYFTRYNLSFVEEPESERVRLMSHTDILGEGLKPTVAGLLIFGLAPERFLQCSGISFAHFGGKILTETLIDKKTIQGSLSRQVEGCMAAVKANLIVGSNIEGAKRLEKPHYPDRVFRELIVNACVHRNYSIQFLKCCSKIGLRGGVPYAIGISGIIASVGPLVARFCNAVCH